MAAGLVGRLDRVREQRSGVGDRRADRERAPDPLRQEGPPGADLGRRAHRRRVEPLERRLVVVIPAGVVAPRVRAVLARDVSHDRRDRVRRERREREPLDAHLAPRRPPSDPLEPAMRRGLVDVVADGREHQHAPRREIDELPEHGERVLVRPLQVVGDPDQRLRALGRALDEARERADGRRALDQRRRVEEHLPAPNRLPRAEDGEEPRRERAIAGVGIGRRGVAPSTPPRRRHREQIDRLVDAVERHALRGARPPPQDDVATPLGVGGERRDERALPRAGRPCERDELEGAGGSALERRRERAALRFATDERDGALSAAHEDRRARAEGRQQQLGDLLERGARLGLAREQRVHHLDDDTRRVGREARERWRVVHERRREAREALALVWQPAGEELEEDHPERVTIGGGRRGGAPRLLGRHVADGPDDLPVSIGLRPTRVRELRQDAEVEDLQGAVAAHENVRWLEVAVHDPARVEEREPFEELRQHVRQPAEVKGHRREALLGRFHGARGERSLPRDIRLRPLERARRIERLVRGQRGDAREPIARA